tara:strand:+ start:361 stop:522 length:162 start_codon:yes stop_codon:yes gene_type:complete
MEQKLEDQPKKNQHQKKIKIKKRNNYCLVPVIGYLNGTKSSTSASWRGVRYYA